MELQLDPAAAEGYSNRAQIARIVTERWVSRQLYCPACPGDSLSPTRAGTKVVDFTCETCEEAFQLKSLGRPFGSKVTDAAYAPMIERVDRSDAPNFLFLQYRADRWVVRNLFLVPRFFLSSSVIQRRRALGSSARRAGWVGCNILLGSLPHDARIVAIRDEVPLPPETVRDSWQRFAFLGSRDVESRGWMADVLACVRQLGRETFALTDVYAFESRLSPLHPRNRNIRPKIRQQLQVMRDHGVLEFLGRGRYRILTL